jgi:urease accessory protein
MDALLLLLLDSRAPAGAHHHSGGMEPAIMHGVVRDLGDVEEFCRARLQTSGMVAASFAAAACEAWQAGRDLACWATFDAEYDARLPSVALREASRALGRGLLRLVRAVRPGASATHLRDRLDVTAAHHPVVLGAAVAACAGSAELAARAAALTSCTSAASAAVRLLGLDPIATHGMLAGLAAPIDSVAAAATQLAHGCEPSELPAYSAPALDLLADAHRIVEVRLFAS